jgi:hypothetical protein
MNLQLYYIGGRDLGRPACPKPGCPSADAQALRVRGPADMAGAARRFCRAFGIRRGFTVLSQGHLLSPVSL